MSFIENKGQWTSNIKYQSELNFGSIYFEKDNFTFVLVENKDKHNHNSSEYENHKKNLTLKGHHFKIKFLNANENVSFSEENKSGNYYNYFIGNDRTKWKSKVHSYKKIVYHNLYDGIDMKVEGEGDNMKYEYYVEPFANPNDIKVKYVGLDKIKLKDGNLVYETEIAGIIEKKPIVFQYINDKKVYIDCKYSLDKENKIVQFNLLEEYDNSKELIIDPSLVFSSYTGSTINNFGYTATYDNDGNLFGGGIVYGTGSGLSGYPSINSFNLSDVTSGGTTSSSHGYASDMSISKFSSDGTTLLYSTLVGGSDNEQPQSLITDSLGNLYIYGRTFSSNFPTSAGAYDGTINGGSDIVITKISTDGLTLMGSTFVGGSNDDGINMNATTSSNTVLKYNYADDGRGEIILDENGNVYVTSSTKSNNIFSTTSGFQNSMAGIQDAVVFQLNSDLTSIIWGSYLGGNDNDAGYSLKLDNIGNLFVAGGTKSTNFPNTSGGLLSSFQGGRADGFLAKINVDGTVLYQSTYLGTSDYDQSYFVEIDEFNNVYAFGQTTGSYLVTSGVYSNANSSQFIHKLNNDLDATIFSTVFGSGSSNINISPTAFLVDNCLNIYISGWGGNSNNGFNSATGNTMNMPLTADAFQSTTDGDDFYFMVLSADAEDLLYGSYFGSSSSAEHVDGGTSRFSKEGVIYQAVCASCGSSSSNFPTTPGSWSQTDNSSSGGCNLGVIKMDVYMIPSIIDVTANPTASGCVPLTVNFQSDLVNVNSVEWNFDDGTTSNLEDPTHIFTDTGTYLIQLIGEDTTLCNLRDTAYLTVIVGDDSLVVNFIDNSIIDCNDNSFSAITSNYSTTEYLWTMGDGNSYTTDSVFHQYANAGTYAVNLLLIDSNSCELRDSVQTSVTILPTIETSYTLEDTFGCIPMALDFTVVLNIPVDSFLWDFGDGNTSNLNSIIYTYTTAGNYIATFYAVDSNTCNISDSASFYINTIGDFAVADITVDETLFGCDSMQINVQSNNLIGTHYWDFGDGSTSTAMTQTHTYTSFGTYNAFYVIYDTTKSCNPYDTAFFDVKFEKLNVNIQLSDTIACIPFDLGFSTLTNAQNYYWDFGTGDVSNTQNGTYTYLNEGNFNISLIAVDSTTCNFTDTSYASILTIDTRVIAEFDFTILNSCDSLLSIHLDNQSLNANIYNWYFDNSDLQTMEEPGIYNFNTTGAHNITLIVRNDTLCTPLDTFSVDFELLPNVEAQFNVFDNCDNKIIEIENNSILGNVFNWNFGNGETSTEYIPNVSYATGFYSISLIVIDSNSCNLIDSTNADINIINSAIANFVTDSIEYLYPDEVYFTNLSSNYSNFLWEFGDGEKNNDEENPIHFYKIINDLKPCLIVSNEFCADTICRDITINFQELIGVPNAFSPNGDGVNDTIFVEGVGIVELNFSIFNRWGEKVFETENQKIGWDGNFKGIKQEIEVYTYFLNVVYLNGNSVRQKGNISLIK